MQPIKLRKACSQYGADRGRPTFLPGDRGVKVRLRLVRMNLDSGGYDSGGAYWGLRPWQMECNRAKGLPILRLYWAESVEEFELGPYDRPPVGTIEMVVEAACRSDAKQQIRQVLPNATFFR